MSPGVQLALDLGPALLWRPCQPRRVGPGAPWYTLPGEEAELHGVLLHVSYEEARWWWRLDPVYFRDHSNSGPAPTRAAARDAAAAAALAGAHLAPAGVDTTAADASRMRV